MLLDGYDPHAVKLYSKCARNQASKLTHNKRPNSSTRPYSSLIVYSEGSRKKR